MESDRTAALSILPGAVLFFGNQLINQPAGQMAPLLVRDHLDAIQSVGD